jgi:hypothetical protein
MAGVPLCGVAIDVLDLSMPLAALLICPLALHSTSPLLVAPALWLHLSFPSSFALVPPMPRAAGLGCSSTL